METIMSVGFSESVVTPGITSLVSKGDIVSSDGTSRVRVPVGTDGKILTSQSSTSTGVLWADGPVATQSSLVLIESSTLTAEASSFTFSNLPTSYHTFRMIFQGKVTTTQTGFDGRSPEIRLNGDTVGSNYMVSYVFGTAGATIANAEDKGSFTGFNVGAVSSDMGTNPDNTYYRGILSLEISGANSTSVYKNVRTTGGNGQGPTVRRLSGLWISTSAVTSITVLDISRNLGPGTSIELYGMK
jgi:hypothetical protein